MATRDGGSNRRKAAGPTGPAAAEYALLLELERYESLLEDLEELGVDTADELRRRIRELHARLDVDDGPR